MNRFSLTTDIISYKKNKSDINIIHISDIHFNINTKDTFLSRLYDYIKKQNPNYIMITGDLLDTPKIVKDNKINELLSFLKKIANVAPLLISIGNHDIIMEDDFIFFDELNKIKNVFVLNNESYEDDNIFVFGLTLPNNYYYNVTWQEPVEILLAVLNRQSNKWKKEYSKPAILLVHSPIRLTNSDVLNVIKPFDLVLSGHTHNGMVPKLLYPIFPKNMGIVSPIEKLLPKIAKGKIIEEINNKKITIIINGAITKLSKQSGKILSRLNFLYNSSVNKIIIKKEGKK